MPLYFQSVLEASPIRSGLLLLPFIVTGAISGVLCGFIIHQTGRFREIIWIGTLLLTLGFGLFISFDATTSTPKAVCFLIVGGLGSGPTPFNLLSAALAACTTMTLRLHAMANGLPVDRISTSVSHRKDGDAERSDLFSRRIVIDGEIDEAQRAAMLGAADRCPVHRTLERGSRFSPPVVEGKSFRPDAP